MSLDNTPTGLITCIASADLSAKQYFLVKIDTNGEVALAGAGECAIGVLYTKPGARGVACSVAPLVPGAKLKAVAGGILTKGMLLKSDANGKLAEAVAGRTKTDDGGAAADPLLGSFVIGVAIAAAGADGDVIQFLAQPMGSVPTTAS